MSPGISSLMTRCQALVLVFCGACLVTSAPCFGVVPLVSLQEVTLNQPWEFRASSRPSSEGLSTLSDVSQDVTSTIIRRVLRVRSAFKPLLDGIPSAISESPGLLVFSNTDEMFFTLRTRLAVSTELGSPVVSFSNASGQFIALAVDQNNALALDRALQASVLEQMLIPFFEGRLPPWARHGLSQYAGSLHWRGDHLASGEACSGFLDLLRSASGQARLVPLERLLTLDAAQWDEFERRGGAIRMQANAWLLVHFLIHGEGGRMIPSFKDWLHAVAIGRDGDLDLADRLAPVFSVGDFEAALSKHLKGLVPGEIDSFREQAEVLRILMQELEDSGLRPGDLKALEVELSLLADREIDLHQLPFRRSLRYSGIDFFDSGSIRIIADDVSGDKKNDPPAVSAPMGLEFVHPSGESLRIDWIIDGSTGSQIRWRPIVVW